jgi:Ca2+-transporting ATPase
MIRFFVQLKTKANRTGDEKGQDFIKILIIAVTLVVVAVPEGLPLAVTLALAFATKRMTKENLLVRVLASCETMASTSVICTDKTGTLTTNQMAVVSASFVDRQVVRDMAEHPRRIHSDADAEATNEQALGAQHLRPAFNLAELKDNISPELADLINMSVALNSTAFEQTDKETGLITFIGSKTECALLEMCAEQGWTSAKDLRDANEPEHIFPFSSMQKSSGAVIRLPNGQFRLLVKGASEIVLGMANKYVVTTAASGLPTETLHAEIKHSIEDTITFYARQSLRTIGLAYRDVPAWPPAEWIPANEDEKEAGPPFSLLTEDLTFIGVTAIEDVSDALCLTYACLPFLVAPSKRCHSGRRQLQACRSPSQDVHR